MWTLNGRLFAWIGKLETKKKSNQKRNSEKTGSRTLSKLWLLFSEDWEKIMHVENSKMLFYKVQWEIKKELIEIKKCDRNNFHVKLGS